MDATHPQHNPALASGWIRRGEEQVISTNTVRRRVNINGAIDLERLEPVVRFDDTINADSTIGDNAPYYRSKAVQDHLKASRIQLVSLPRYALNLNLIERLLWRFFKKRVLYNLHCEYVCRISNSV